MVAGFPAAAENQAKKTQFTDEVWITGKNGVVNSVFITMFSWALFWQFIYLCFTINLYE
jgi:hypothetical protein